MKFCLLLMLISVSQLFADAFGQNNRVSLKLENKSLVELMDVIQEKTDYSFIYSAKEIEKVKSVSIEVKNALLKDVLDKVLEGTGIRYIIENNLIIFNKELYTINQQKTNTIKGQVKDTKGVPLPGVSIVVKGTNIGVSTDVNGDFRLSANKGDILVVSFIGMQTKEIKLTSLDDLNIVLKEDKQELEEVVVTSYFQKKKNSFSGAVTTMTREEIKKVSTGNLITTLENLDASFRIKRDNANGSDPNRELDISIRGRGSFQAGSTNPIFIVDGFEMGIDKVFDMDENRVEKVSILKDASATILYGSRAANGVVLIETRAPKAGKLIVDYNFKPTVSIVDLTGYNLMNAREKLEFEKAAGIFTHRYNAFTQLEYEKEYERRYKEVLRGVDTDWLAQPVENAFSQQHSLNVEGGTKAVKYGVNLNYNDKSGVMKESGRDVVGVGFYLSYRINDKITFKNYASYSYAEGYNSPYGKFSTYARSNPWEAIYEDNGELRKFLANSSVNNASYLEKRINPLYNATLGNIDENNYHEFRNNLSVDIFLSDALRLKGSFSFAKTLSSSTKFISPNVYEKDSSKDPEDKGELRLGNGEKKNFSGNVVLSYNKEIEKHAIFLGVGSEVRNNESFNDMRKYFGFLDDEHVSPAFAMRYDKNKPSGYIEQTVHSLSFFCNANYIYDNRFFIDCSVRTDGSSNFGDENKYGLFYSLGGGWNIHNESYWNKDLFSRFKIRFSHGLTGNQQFSAYQARTTYNYVTRHSYNGEYIATLMGYGNDNLEWQQQESDNFGVDMECFDRRVKMTVDLYRKITHGMLTDVTVAPQLGFLSGTYKENLGKIENLGFDVRLFGTIIDNKESSLFWNVGIQAQHNKNTLKEINDELRSVNDENNLDLITPKTLYKKGESINAIYAVRSLGINPVNGKELYLTKDNEKTYVWSAKDKVVCGNTDPVVSGNISNNLYYKGFSLTAVFNYDLGGDAYDDTAARLIEGASPFFNADKRVFNERWKQPGDVTFYKDIADRTVSYATSRFVKKENVLSLSVLNLSYQFSKKFTKKLGLRTAKLNFTTNNVFYLTTLTQERGTRYPFARSFSLGFSLGL